MSMLHKTDREIAEGVSPAMADRLIFMSNMEQRASEMPGSGSVREQIASGKMKGASR